MRCVPNRPISISCATRCCIIGRARHRRRAPGVEVGRNGTVVPSASPSSSDGQTWDALFAVRDPPYISAQSRRSVPRRRAGWAAAIKPSRIPETAGRRRFEECQAGREASIASSECHRDRHQTGVFGGNGTAFKPHSPTSATSPRPRRDRHHHQQLSSRTIAPGGRQAPRCPPPHRRRTPTPPRDRPSSQPAQHG